MRSIVLIVSCLALLTGCKSPRSADAPEPSKATGERAGPVTPGGVPLEDVGPAVRREAMRLARDRAEAVDRLVEVGAEARPTLRALLRSDNLAEVRGAVEWYDRVRPEGATEDLAAILDHPARDVRERVVAVLANLEAPEAGAALARRLGVEEAPLLRARIADALRLSEARGAVPALLKALDADHELVVARAGYAAAALGDGETAEALAERAGGEGVLPAYGALYGLRRAGEAPPLSTLEAALGRDDVRVATEATRALEHVEGAEAVGPLLERAAGDERPAVRRAALEVRAAREPDEAAATARRALDDDAPEVRVTVLAVLSAAMAPAERLETLVAHVDDASPLVRAAAAVYVERTADEAEGDAAAEALRSRLPEEEDPMARRRLVRALGALGGRETARALLPVVSREGDPARDDAREALQRITGQDGGYAEAKWRPVVEALAEPGGDEESEPGGDAARPRSGGGGR
ncbi:MAG: HEAT repeat domain-containing protein [Myxococcota bacterium]